MNNEEIINAYKNGLSIQKVVEKYNITSWKAGNIIRDAGIIRTHKEATDNINKIKGHGNRFVYTDNEQIK